MSTIPSDQLRQTSELLEPAKAVHILLPNQPNLDTAASGLALYLALSATGKQVSLSCPSLMMVEFSHLVGVDKITNTIGGEQGKNLVISFPYQEGSIEKVSYNIELDTFNLVIEPREGYPMITSDAIRFSYAGGGQPDLLITIGISKLSDLQQILGNSASLIEAKPFITIDNSPDHERMGKLDLVVPSASSLSEIITDILTSLSLRLDGDIATNLLAGIIDASDNFSSPNTTAQTFESAALLSRSGARKTPMTSRQQQQPPAPSLPRMPNYLAPQAQPPRMSPPAFQQPYQQPMPQQQQPVRQPRPFGGQQPLRQQLPQQPPMQQSPRPQQPMLQQQQSVPPVQQPMAQQQPNETPADWLKPKIYKGSSIS